MTVVIIQYDNNIIHVITHTPLVICGSVSHVTPVMIPGSTITGTALNRNQYYNSVLLLLGYTIHW